MALHGAVLEISADQEDLSDAWVFRIAHQLARNGRRGAFDFDFHPDVAHHEVYDATGYRALADKRKARNLEGASDSCLKVFFVTESEPVLPKETGDKFGSHGA